MYDALKYFLAHIVKYTGADDNPGYMLFGM